MAHEGMVHALDECRRVLRPGGLLVDLRPYDGVWPLEVVTDNGASVVGALDYSQDGPDDRAADEAIDEAVRLGWFQRERTARFNFSWYWDSVAALDSYLAERPTKVQWMPEGTRDVAREALSLAGPGARLRILRGMLIGRYLKPSR